MIKTHYRCHDIAKFRVIEDGINHNDQSIYMVELTDTFGTMCTVIVTIQTNEYNSRISGYIDYFAYEAFDIIKTPKQETRTDWIQTIPELDSTYFQVYPEDQPGRVQVELSQYEIARMTVCQPGVEYPITEILNKN